MKNKGNGCLSGVLWLSLIFLAVLAPVLLMIYLLVRDLRWGYLFLPLIFIGAWFYGKNEEKKKKKAAADYLRAGELLFADQREGFTEFYQSYLRRKKKEEDEPMDALNEFADGRNLLGVTDWRGEENEGEVEEFIEQLLGQKIVWTHTALLRSEVPLDEQRDGGFIVDLFKAMDKDLKAIDRRLLFLGLSDTYEYMVVPVRVLEDVRKMKLSGLRGAGELRK